MKRILRALAFAAALLPGIAAAQVPQFPQTLPGSTVIGRLGTQPGPSQAIPFPVLLSQLLQLGNQVQFPGYFGLSIFNSQVANYTVQASDCSGIIQAGGSAFFTVTFPATAGFPASCAVTINNVDTGRGKAVAGAVQGINCSSSNILWPLQSCTVGIVNNSWTVITRPGRWKPPANTTINFFTDFTNGTDTLGATDGLAAGASAFKSAEWCGLNTSDQIDFNSLRATKVVCNMAAATADTQGMHSPVHALTGADGGAAFQIVGASLAVTGAVSNGGLCEITVPSTATYTANQVVSVYSVGGATGCNGTWKVTVTDITHLTLQSTTFGGAYTSGGTVTNGSSIATTGVDAVDCYFGTVMQFSNVTFSSNVNGLGLLWGCKVYLLQGNIFTGSPAGGHFNLQGPSKIEIDNDYGIASGAGFHVLTEQMAQYSAGLAMNINIVPGINPTFTQFVFATSVSVANFNQITINTNSNTVTGQRFLGSEGANIQTGLANGSLTYFPGSTAGSVGSGSTYDTVMNTTVAQGGTGVQTMTAHGLVIGEGTSAVASVGPCNSNVPITGTSATTDPQCGGTIPAANGGTGNTSTAAEQARLAISILESCITGVNFNSANTDNAIPFTMPTGFTRMMPFRFTIQNASHSLTTATLGIFSATAAGGVAIVAAGTAIALSAATDATLNNAQTVGPINNATFLAASLATPNTVYFRTGTAEGAAATGDVCFDYLARP